jgi:biopolymer transport protein ExbD
VPVESKPPKNPKSGATPSVNSWLWDDDDDDDDDEEAVKPADLDDIEVLADESSLEELGERTTHVSRSRLPTSGELPDQQVDSRDHPNQRIHPAEDLEPPAQRGDDPIVETKPDSRSSHVALPVVRSRDREQLATPSEVEENREEAFSLSRSATQKIEELDLAPMVDVAFQLVLFFMVTATTVLYKTLEIPRPSSETPAVAVAQGRSRSLDDLKDDYILVEIDEHGAMKLDREPIEPAIENLVEQLRRARERTGRKSMLLSADFATPHRNAVLAYDAANEIGLGIAIARPQSPQGPAPTLRAAPPAPGAVAVPATPAPS